MMTLQVGHGALLLPVPAPVTYVPLRAVADAAFGRVNSSHASYQRYRKYLRRTVEEPFAVFLTG